MKPLEYEEYDDSTSTITINEYALHDVIVGFSNTISGMYHDIDDTILAVEVVSSGNNNNEFDQKMCDRYTNQINTLMELIRNMDLTIHDDAEQTCL